MARSMIREALIRQKWYERKRTRHTKPLRDVYESKEADRKAAADNINNKG